MSVFTHDNWELDTKNGAISENGKIIAEVFGATDFNPDNAEAMLRAKAITAAPKLFNSLQAITFLCSNIVNSMHELVSLLDHAQKIITEVEHE